MGTDRYAYQSRLRRISPMPKLLLTGSALVLCLLCDSVTVGLVTLLGMWGLVTALGGLSPRVFLRFLCIPMAFLAVGCVTILINSYPQGAPVLLAVPVGERLWGFDGAALLRAGRLFDVTMALERLHVPHLMVELMELIYRFIFVLTETASRIRLAQESRLGYQGLRRSLSSLGTLASMVFLRAWRKADRVYTALESRGYSGSLVTLSGDYARGAWLYPLTAAVAAVQLAAWYFERRVMG